MAHAPGIAMPRQVEAERATVPRGRMRGAAGGTPKGNRNALRHGKVSIGVEL
jgi:uncharacterized protein YjcR